MRAEKCVAPLGIVLNQWTADPATDSEADKAMAELEYARSVQWFMDPILRDVILKWRSVPMATKHRMCIADDFRQIQQPLDFRRELLFPCLL